MKWIRLSALVLSVLLLSRWSCWAEITLTNEKYEELVGIMDQLEAMNEEQKKSIQLLEMRNEELWRSSQNKDLMLKEQQNVIDQQENLYNEEKKSCVRLGVAISIISLILGFIAGAAI